MAVVNNLTQSDEKNISKKVFEYFILPCTYYHWEVIMKKQNKKYKEKSKGMSALADGNLGNNMGNFLFDPNGSWTGTPYVGLMGEEFMDPEQDVDDL